MSEQDLGPMPDPEIEPREPNPGGADAVEQITPDVVPDPDPLHNPATDQAPQTTRETEDTSTEATRGEDADDGTSTKESPA